MTETPTPKRIDALDALRGFALAGILLIHCMEHFELYVYPETTSPVMKWFDTTLAQLLRTLVSGKAYAIFALLFGVSFFIQMDNGRQRGVDFRGRFIWRMALLYLFGYINGLMYAGEIFAVYAVMGLILIPLYKLPERWLKVLCVIALFHLPYLVCAVAMLVDPSIERAPLAGALERAMVLFRESTTVYRDGTLAEVLSYNLWSGHEQKWLWIIGRTRLVQIVGLFTLGLLLARRGVHRDEEKMVWYAKRALGWGFVLMVAFSVVKNLLPLGEWSRPTMRFAVDMAKYYFDLGVFFMLLGGFLLAYFRLDARRVLDGLAPMGRMSVTNYMSQSLIGALLFFGYGFGLAEKLGPAVSIALGVGLVALQIYASRWWMRHYHYGPLEWLWRGLTRGTLRGVPFRKIRNG